LAKSAVFLIWSEEENKGVGVGFFFKQGFAVTASHNVKNPQDMEPTPAGTEVKGVFGSPHEGKTVFLAVTADYPKLDICCLRLVACEPAGFVPVFLPLDLTPVDVSTPAWLLSYQTGLANDLKDRFNLAMHHVRAEFMADPNPRHLLYSCLAWPGDSGSALILANGKVVGLHIETVNHFEERKRLAGANSKARLTDIEKSIDMLIRGSAHGYIAVNAQALDDCITGKAAASSSSGNAASSSSSSGPAILALPESKKRRTQGLGTHALSGDDDDGAEDAFDDDGAEDAVNDDGAEDDDE